MTEVGVDIADKRNAPKREAQDGTREARSTVRRPQRRRRKGPLIRSLQLTILAAFLLAWEFLPMIGALRRSSHFLDPFFISSPSAIVSELINLATGRNNTVMIWPYAWPTLSASLLGIVLGTLLGAVMGLLLSNSQFWSDVLNPFVVAINAIPRIALIPIIVILVGPTFEASIINCVLVVFFVAFFNAYEGGISVPKELLDNARVMRATKWQVIYQIRLRYTMAWTLAALPLAVAFGLLAVVTGEILTGYGGLGELISQAALTANATETFAVVVILSILGSAIVASANVVKGRVLHWWARG